MGSAKQLRRYGLAAAFGIGLAVLAGHGEASAAPGDSRPSSPGSSQSSASGSGSSSAGAPGASASGAASRTANPKPGSVGAGRRTTQRDGSAATVNRKTEPTLRSPSLGNSPAPTGATATPDSPAGPSDSPVQLTATAVGVRRESLDTVSRASASLQAPAADASTPAFVSLPAPGAEPAPPAPVGPPTPNVEKPPPALAPRSVIVSLPITRMYFPDVNQQKETGINTLATGDPIASRQVIYSSSADDNLRVTYAVDVYSSAQSAHAAYMEAIGKSLIAGGFQQLPDPHIGEESFAGTSAGEGGQAHVGVGVRIGNIVVGVTRAGYDTDPQTIKDIETLTRLQAWNAALFVPLFGMAGLV
jgi:hypothetical protein